MPRSLFASALLCLPALASAGQPVLSPPLLYVDNGQHSTEVLLAYQPGANVASMSTVVRFNLDRLGWADVQVVPSPTPEFETRCHIASGHVSAVVTSRQWTALPTAVPIPLCRLRVRPHAHTPRGHYEIDTPVYLETTPGFASTQYTGTSRVRVTVP